MVGVGVKVKVRVMVHACFISGHFASPYGVHVQDLLIR